MSKKPESILDKINIRQYLSMTLWCILWHNAWIKKNTQYLCLSFQCACTYIHGNTSTLILKVMHKSFLIWSFLVKEIQPISAWTTENSFILKCKNAC